MTTTTPLHGFGGYTTSDRVEDYVAGYLGEFVDDYDFEGLVAAYREAVNEQLGDTGISLHGDNFYSTYPAPEDSADLIKAAIENADLGTIAAEYDTTAQ